MIEKNSKGGQNQFLTAHLFDKTLESVVHDVFGLLIRHRYLPLGAEVVDAQFDHVA